MGDELDVISLLNELNTYWADCEMVQLWRKDVLALLARLEAAEARVAAGVDPAGADRRRLDHKQ